MRAGQLRHRITVQTITMSRDTSGEEVEGSPSTLRTVYGRARKLSGGEAFYSGQVIADAQWKFHFRAIDVAEVVAGIASGTTKYQLSYDGRTFAVLDVHNPDEKGAETVLTCSEN